MSRNAQRDAEKRKTEFTLITQAWDKENAKINTDKVAEKNIGRESLVAKVRADISAKHSWDEVLLLLNDARDTYNNPKGTFRRWIRKGADKSEVVEPFVAFIPTGEYTSIVWRGINFVLRVASILHYTIAVLRSDR